MPEAAGETIEIHKGSDPDLFGSEHSENNSARLSSHASSVENTETALQEDDPKDFVPLKLSLREQIFLTLTEPTHSTLAYCLSFYFDGLVALSMVFMCSQTVAAWSHSPQQQALWQTLETILAANFLVDFLLKVCTARPLFQFIVSKPTFTIDLLGILPFFIENLIEHFSKNDSSSIKALRVFRLFRFFRLSRIAYENFPDFRMFIQAVRRSKLAIAFLGMYVFGAGLFFASCIYYAEISECELIESVWYYSDTARTAKRVPCSIQDMFGAWWYTLVTMTTVGYGDTIVTSTWGKILTVLIMIGSLVFLALPSAIFAANLTEMYLDRRLMKKLHPHHPTGPSIAASPTVSIRHEPKPTGIGAKKIPLSGNDGAEIESLLANVDAANEQVQSALSSLTTHLTFIQHQQQQLQNLLISNRLKNQNQSK